MDLRLVTVAFDPETGGFPEQPLKDLEGEIVDVVEHFFHHAQQPHLLLVVHLRPPADERKPSRRKKKRSGHRETLTPEEIELYDRLRVWRNARARAEGVPPFVIMTNKQVAEIARWRPGNIAALGEIEGIGEAKTGRYGRQILEVVAHRAAGALPAPAGGAGGKQNAG